LDFDEFLSGPVAPKKKKKKVPDTPTWTQVAEMGPESVGEFIREQHPQTCAFVLSRIDQTFAARVLNDLPDELCSAIVLRLVEISPIEHPVTAEVEKLILRSFSHKQESEPDGDALERVAGVVNELTVERADKIVEMLRVNDEAKADLIRKFLFRFEGIEALERQDRAILFDGWPAEEIAQALLGVSDSMKEGILDVLSQRTRRSVENEMTDNKATEEEILDTRRRIAKRAVALSREGRIRMAASE
jgi:flagellar motor switch protein FliG